MTRSKAWERCGYGLIAFSVILLDQLVKFLCYRNLRPIGSYDLWHGVFRLTYCENTGAAFSLLAGKTWIFTTATVILCSLIVFLLVRGKIRTLWGRISLVWIVSGGIGNLIDRLFRGFVVDMFDFYLIDFAVFNVADIFVTCGSVLFILIYLRTRGEVLDL